MDRERLLSQSTASSSSTTKRSPPSRPLRRDGFSPTRSDEEVITMEICGEYFKLPSDKDIWQYFRTHYRHFFPSRGTDPLCPPSGESVADQSRYPTAPDARQWASHDPIQPMDTLPLPVCGYTRSGRDRCVKPYPTMATAPPRIWTIMASSWPPHLPHGHDHAVPLLAARP